MPLYAVKLDRLAPGAQAVDATSCAVASATTTTAEKAYAAPASDRRVSWRIVRAVMAALLILTSGDYAPRFVYSFGTGAPLETPLAHGLDEVRYLVRPDPIEVTRAGSASRARQADGADPPSGKITVVAGFELQRPQVFQPAVPVNAGQPVVQVLPAYDARAPPDTRERFAG